MFEIDIERKSQNPLVMKELGRRMGIIMVGPEQLREQQPDQPLQIKDEEMFDKTLEYIHLIPSWPAL